MITSTTRACPRCYALLGDPTATTCDRCGRTMAPRHESWPPLLKWWLLSWSIAQVLHHYTWKSPQEIWEEQLRRTLCGGPLTQPNTWGLDIHNGTPIADLYPLALERARWWQQAGSPIAVRVLAPPAVLTPPLQELRYDAGSAVR